MEGSGLGIEEGDEVESNPKRHAALFSALQSSMEELSLSRQNNQNSNPIVLPELQQKATNERGEGAREHFKPGEGSFRGKATMQEMMDELSFLKNMIQAELDGEPF